MSNQTKVYDMLLADKSFRDVGFSNNFTYAIDKVTGDWVYLPSAWSVKKAKAHIAEKRGIAA